MFTAGTTRKGFLFFCFIMTGLMAVAQDADSVRFVKARWKKERIGRGTKLVTHHFRDKDLFMANQFIAYAVVKNHGRKRGFHIAAEKKLLKPVSVFAKEAGALVAINGNFFNTKEGGSVDYVRVDGRVLSGNLVNARGKMSVHQKAAVVIQDGKLAIVEGGARPGWPDSVPAASVLANGPLLLQNAADAPVDPSAFSKNRHPRTAVGITKKGAVILLVADGRSPEAAGLSLEELRKLMRWLHCVAAINFDGGGSTTLWTQKRGVINHPSDNKKWDHKGERAVANALFYSR
ncbi:phosphodiester glycosidase family protein [Niabella aurantiaca]|uniref:phosphodiester glycosidase family protein n=1 Tax=Niabella aurantiaca TaxID=379900 RepID=UPI0012F9570A|nr:phosphodiester glycosidase family protein [Niabella aurantiaca]